MKTINLRDYYPFYTRDTFLEVSDIVAEALAEAERQERNYLRRLFYNKAHYSLDAEDGIETAIEVSEMECHILTPEAALNLMERHCRICRALNALPETQGRRIEAHYFLGKSQKEIAEEEGVAKSSVSESIKKGLMAMREYLKEN